MEHLQSSVPEQIENATSLINKEIESAGRFVYPGKGTIIIKDPAFNKWGDMSATIEHEP